MRVFARVAICAAMASVGCGRVSREGASTAGGGTAMAIAGRGGLDAGAMTSAVGSNAGSGGGGSGAAGKRRRGSGRQGRERRARGCRRCGWSAGIARSFLFQRRRVPQGLRRSRLLEQRVLLPLASHLLSGQGRRLLQREMQEQR
ncbi:MAG TPA: hypothetical protein VGJ84_22115 [Polyangiaceae bacterium]